MYVCNTFELFVKSIFILNLCMHSLLIGNCLICTLPLYKVEYFGSLDITLPFAVSVNSKTLSS